MFKLKTFDRYLIRKYVSTFFFSLLIFTAISMAIDFSEKVKSFIEKPCTLQEILIDYYLGFIFYMGGLLLPLYVLIAVIFFTSRMAFNAEILSLLNAGVSFRRLLRPYLLTALGIFILHLALNHFVVPYTSKARLKFERTYVWTDPKGRNSNVYMLVAPDTRIFVRDYNPNNQTIIGLRVDKFHGSRLVSLLHAQQAEWKEESQRWRLSAYTIRTFDGFRETFVDGSRPLDTALLLTPEDFVWFHNLNEEMTTPELLASIERDRKRGLITSRQFEIELHRRTADAFTTLILTLIGVAVAARKVRGGMGLHLAVGIGLGAAYILLSKFAVSFAASGTVPPSIGMWMPNMVFTGVAFWLMHRAQK
ncbi:MAG: LptF/LptG family permease [Saprospiraceae bacterium]|nr:LptF/LptG family permease [Saprospiraceae bacterium]MDW8483483.1 LptF/LptG family permease [Saprospiraceae bacterium]